MPPKNDNHLPQCKDGACANESAIIDLRADMKIVKNALVGDLETGKPGLVDEVRNLKAARKADEAAKNRWRNVAFGGIGAAVAGFATWIVTLVTGKAG